MNYERRYNQIVEHYRKLELEFDFELHHIIPRSLGGSDDASNLVRLTRRAHFVCHLLLVKMHTGGAQRKMLHALNMMSNMKRYATSKQYAYARQLISQVLSDTAKKRNRKFWDDPEARAKFSETQRTVNADPVVKQRKSASQKRAWSSPELLERQSQKSRQVAKRPEVNEKLRQSLAIANQNPQYSQRRSEAQRRRWAIYRKNRDVS